MSATTIRTPAGTELVLRMCQGLDELDACVELQVKTWGYNDGDVIPRRMFIVAQRIGGQVVGAFERAPATAASEGSETLVGFAMSLPGIKPGKAPGYAPVPYLHSHMLAVTPEHRNAGIGRKLKLFQRDEALDRRIALMEWTFDPLEIKNAYFNMERLGAIVRRYVPNQYGTTSSFLHGGLPTDRCIAEWWIASPRARAIIAGEKFQRNPAEVRIAIPSDIATIRSSDPKRAREIQKGACEQFQSAFDRGMAVIGFEKSNEAGTYLLGQWESN